LKDLLQRSLTGILIVALILGGILVHPLVFAGVFSIFMLLVLYEFFIISEKLGFQPMIVPGLIAVLLLFFLFFITANHFIEKEFLAFAAIIPVGILLADLFSDKNASFKNGLITLAGVVYVGLPFSLLNYIETPVSNQGQGFYPWLLVGVFFIIWVYDSAAYIFGNLAGRHKICVRISPAKSWEGLIGGAVFAVLMGIGNSLLFDILSIESWIVVALLVVGFGTASDFFESKLKREAGVKDSGNILPGHGGFLDRFDTLLFAVPAIFVWIVLFGNI
jgi:phosphatidate cytidylyltransferase